MSQSGVTPGPIVTIQCPSLKNLTLVPVAMSGSETLGRPFEFLIDVISPTPQLPPKDLLGASLTLQMEVPGFQLRNFNGVVAGFENRGALSSGFLARLWVRPWLWLLTQSANCSIWSPSPPGSAAAKCVSVTDILKEVFEQEIPGSGDLLYPNAAVDYSKLRGTYQPLDLACQYRETDFNFVTRLMEEAGIYYYFTHTPTSHTMVLVDQIQSTTDPMPSISYSPTGGQLGALIEHVSEWNESFHVRTGRVSFSDYDFEKPRWPVSESTGAAFGYVSDNTVRYDYPGDLLTGTLVVGPGSKDYATVRLQQAQLGLVEFTGKTNSRTLAVGQVFTLTDHPIAGYDDKYLVVSANYRISPPDPSSGNNSFALYMCQFTAIRNDTQYRTPASATKPFVRGPQTAVVVGKQDDEICTDKYGRVCIKMHWERETKNDQNLLCFARVSQILAGSGWGAVFTPRVGHEVIVDFLEGDPDRPIITGRLHNGVNMPPYQVASHPTVSGIRTHSSPKGSLNNFNEIRFEDRKGGEELYIQAEKTQTTLVKGSQSISVYGDRSLQVGGHESHKVKKTRTTEITEDENLTVDDSMKTTVKNDIVTHSQKGHLENSTQNAMVNLTNEGEVLLAANQKGSLDMEASGAIQLMSTAETITIKRDGTTIVVSDTEIKITGSQKVTITANSEAKVTVGSATLDMTPSEASLSLGGSKVDLSPSGVTVTGTMVNLNA